MTVQIDTTAENNAVRFVTQNSHPSAPSAGHVLLYHMTGTGHSGMFVETPGGAKYGPLITGTSTVGGSGALVQRKGNQTGFATGTSVGITYDDSIPESTEGYPFLTQAITPTDANNILYIDVTIFGSVSGADYMIAALFKDSDVNAIAASATFVDTGTATDIVHFRHKMTAGTTSEITFTVRAGRNGGASFMLNGRTSTGRIFGGVACSSITVDEVTP